MAKASAASPYQPVNTKVNYKYFTPTYSNDPLTAMLQYQSDVRKVDPKYNVGMGIWSPGMENPKAQTNKLIDMVLGSAAGAKSKALGKQQNLSDYTKALFKGTYGDQTLRPDQLAAFNAANTAAKNKSRYSALSQIQSYLSGSEKQGGTQADAIAGLYQQLTQDPKGTKKLGQARADTQFGKEAAIQKTPGYQMQYLYNAELKPMVNSKIQQLYDTANELQRYYDTPSKYRAKAFPDGKPSTRGMSEFVPKDQPITPDTINAAAQQLSTPEGTQNYLQNYLVTQAKARGASDNQLQALMQTSNNAQQQLGPNATPFEQMLYDYAFGGGEIGKKKPAAGTQPGTGFISFADLAKKTS